MDILGFTIGAFSILWQLKKPFQNLHIKPETNIGMELNPDLKVSKQK